VRRAEKRFHPHLLNPGAARPKLSTLPDRSHLSVPVDLSAYPKDQAYLVGVSGGHDSVSLLEMLIREGFSRLVVCHLNHQLRGPESEADEAFVRQLAHSHDLPIELGRTDVSAEAASHGLSLEAAGRQARLRFFACCARARQTSHVFLGHHADDQAETVLLHVLRGSGLAGLGGMEEVAHIDSLILLRPYLTLRKRELPPPGQYREDPSNDSAAFLRNRLRHDVLPAIRRALDHDPVPALVRLADIARGEDRLLEELTSDAMNAVLEDHRLKTPALSALSPPLQRRVLLRWLSEEGIPDCGFEEVESIRALLRHTRPQDPAQVNLPGDHHVRRREKRLHLYHAADPL